MAVIGISLRLDAQGALPTSKDPRDPSWMGKEGAARLAVLPPAPLAPIALGRRDFSPQAVGVTTAVDVTAERNSETSMSGPTRLMTGAFDPAFLFIVLFPLVIIALSFELLSGERERGTLAMLLSQPVSQGDLVMGKAAARAAGLSGLTLGFALIGLVVGGADLSSGASWLAAGLYCLILVAWALFWFAAAVAVNAWGSSSARNALSLVGIWLVLVVLIPGVVHVSVDAADPAPSQIELMHTTREAAQNEEKSLVGMQGRHDQDTGTQDYAQKMADLQERLAASSTPVVAEARAQAAKRESLVSSLQYLSPAMVVRSALEDVAGSGPVRHRRFEEQVDAFHLEYRRFFTERIKDGQRIGADDVDAIPTLDFEEERASTLAQRVLVSTLFLFVLAGLLIRFSWRKLRNIGRLTR